MKIKMKLVGEDGNAFAILGRFRKEARRQGMDSAEIDRIIKDAMSSDYNHLLTVIMRHVEMKGV